MRFFSYLLIFLFVVSRGVAQDTGEINYAYPVQYLPLTIESKPVKMAYMDVRSERPNGKVVLLLHGKNFNGYYWKRVIQWLTKNGYRAIIPDQVGWGKSSHPDIHYSFHRLAANTKKLLDTLNIPKVTVLAHSMGGMLGTRFSLMYPQTVEKLILENPIGLEDYKTFVPFQTIEQQYQKELTASYESYKKYQQSYYPIWKPQYEDLVRVQASDLRAPDFKAIAWSNAITYQMIYEQPVVYEFANLAMPTVLILGQEDRTVVGKALLAKSEQERHGQYQALGKKIVQQLKSGKLIELTGIGHIPHIQEPERFLKALQEALQEK
ncbi:alpha/beta fold hydrolase [Tellurirhabdus bombi]|uniref:alpha/beta fold hydrolase n=1 Tax=Tellurirhabdus bombi TaxID=2907205 RepID=UPI001F25E0F6|nr:alpha/beta hydrolase [Tellurirhabdus bombi]